MARAAAWALAGLLAMGAGSPALACQMPLRASVPLRRAGPLFLVPVTLNGTALDFLLDTGAERTVVSLPTAARLGLARDKWASSDVEGAGGRDRRPLGLPRTLSLGGLELRRRTVAADNTVVVGPLPEGVAGLLGQDFLSAFDLDIDAPGGMLRLYDAYGCAAVAPPWPGRVRALPALRPVRNILALMVRVAGQAMLAELDTGASATVLTAPGMARLGVAPGGPDKVHGFGAGQVAARRQAFTLQVDILPPSTVSVVVSPLHTLRSIDVLLGADWVGARRVWVSWATDTVFVPVEPPADVGFAGRPTPEPPP